MLAFAVLALVGAAVATPVAQAVTSAIAPKASAPAGCSTSYSGQFEISIVNTSTTSTKRSTALECTLSNGILTDAEGRTGYIASNYQFQFDKPVQAGAIYTAGWSVCSNGTLALGGSAVFYECLSGTFYNLYDESTGAQCTAVYIDIVGGTSASVSSDGQVTAASATAGAATQLTDGQVQATTSTATPAVSQISDGQIQATTATAVVVSQISDGQIQATTATAAVVSQISDGQIQATTGTAAVVSQISDGQIQATKATTAAVVTQISDGQIQATTATPAVVSQISDGQIQATATNGTVTSATASVVAFTGAAALPSIRAELFGLAAGVLALAAL